MNRNTQTIIGIGFIFLALVIAWSLYGKEDDTSEKDNFLVEVKVDQNTLPRVQAELTYTGPNESVTIYHGLNVFWKLIKGDSVRYNPGDEMYAPLQQTELKRNKPYIEAYDIYRFDKLENGEYEVKIIADFEFNGTSYKIPASAMINIDDPRKKLMAINGKHYRYDEELIKRIDVSNRIDKKNPPTAKSIYPERKPEFTILVKEQDKTMEEYTIWMEKDVYLIKIEKEKESFWLALEKADKEYRKTNELLLKYSNKE